MRITDSLRYGSLQGNIENSLQNLNTVQQQISTGKKLTTFADDPTGASQSLALRSALGDNAQYSRNADQAKSFLSASDSALGSATSLIQSARQIASQAANSDQSPESLAALGSQVDGITQQLTQVANSDLHGKYLFGGTNTQTPPYDATQTYRGNAQSVSATVGPNYQVALNGDGRATFGPAFAALQSLKADLTAAGAGTAGATAALSADLQKFDGGLTALSTARATTGAKLNQVTTVQSHLARAAGTYQEAISNIEDVDLAQAYVQLQSATNVYQASLTATAKASQYSLADFLH